MRMGFFEPRSSLDYAGDSKRLIFCTEGHIGTIRLSRGFLNFDLEAEL